MDNLKLRVGYGVTGLSRVDAYQSLATIDMSKFYTMGGELLNYYQFSQNMTNADLTWEKSYNTNIGVDASFFNGRIDLSADYYFTKTDDVIWNQNIPSVNGMFDASNTYTMLRNIAKTEINGIELTVNTRNIDTKNFKWNSTLTFTKNNEKSTKIIGGDVDHVLRPCSDYSLNSGHPINALHKYQINGILS